jgi:hypothetical protein
MKTLIAKLINVANKLDAKGNHQDANYITKLAYDFANPDKQDRVDDSLAGNRRLPQNLPSYTGQTSDLGDDLGDDLFSDQNVNEFQLDSEDEMPVEPTVEDDDDKKVQIIKDFINLIKETDVEDIMQLMQDKLDSDVAEESMPEAPVADEPMTQEPMPQEDLSQEYSAAPQDIFAPKLSANMKNVILAKYKDLGL